MSEPSTSRERRIHSYLAEQMSETEAEAFEREMFSDDELAAEVERALEIKASRDVPSGSRIARRPPRPARQSRWLALAAGIGAVAIGSALWLTRTAEEPPVMRAGGERLAVQLADEGDSVRATWTAVKDASTYRVEVFTPAGARLYSTESSGLSFLLPNTETADPGGTVYVRVVAIDHLRREIADSGLVKVGS